MKINEEQIKLLARIKKLVYQGKRKFVSRKDRDYLQELLDIGISEGEAWNKVLELSALDYFPDYKPFYSKQDNNDALVFKKQITGACVYIKLI